MVTAQRAESARPRRAQVAALLTSVLLHGLGFIVVRGTLSLPDLELELSLPNEAEFGVVEQPEQAKPDEPPPQPPPAPEPKVQGHEPGAAPAKPVPPKPPKPPPPQPSVLADAGKVSQLAPTGTQLALRLDLERIRATPLAEDVGGLLEALPDVRALLDGSGVSPVRDLSRLFLASPDLRREHVVMAGRYVGDERVARDAVERLAAQRGLQAQWRTQRGVMLAPWHNADTTARVLALLGPELFAITREADLSRVLRAARALSQRAKPNNTNPDADALVAMAERELLNVSVENARSFVRGARVADTPERLQVSVRLSEDGAQLELQVDAHFPDVAQAEAARRYWNDAIARYAGHPMLALLGFDGLLRAAQLTQRQDALTTKLQLPERQARLMLRFARDALHGPSPTDGRAGARNAP